MEENVFSTKTAVMRGEKEEGGGASLELRIRVGKGLIILKC